jgi:hypothetical protein
MVEWDKEAATMTAEDLKKYREALETLNKWETFKREYGWTGYAVVGQILKYEMERR